MNDNDPDETAAILADPETMAAIVEAAAESGPVDPALHQAADDAWDADLEGPPDGNNPRTGIAWNE